MLGTGHCSVAKNNALGRGGGQRPPKQFRTCNRPPISAPFINFIFLSGKLFLMGPQMTSPPPHPGLYHIATWHQPLQQALSAGPAMVECLPFQELQVLLVV